MRDKVDQLRVEVNEVFRPELHLRTAALRFLGSRKRNFQSRAMRRSLHYRKRTRLDILRSL
jgi:hypothetical protein